MSTNSVASLSIDLDNAWSYLKTHGDRDWQKLPSFLTTVVPRMLQLLDELQIRATFFVVGLDAEQDEHASTLRTIATAGHEIANHSHHHEPWLHHYSPLETWLELRRAHQAIAEATGHEPVGFRGPGYASSDAIMRSLSALDYRYDASTLPTWIGPIARTHYFRSTNLSPSERHERRDLFGHSSDALRPIRPYRWTAQDGRAITEIPVTTMPLLRLPMHFTYLLRLADVSTAAANRYWATALWLCQTRGISPSLLLHPLEFLDTDDRAAERLAFLPGAATPFAVKRAHLVRWLAVLKRQRRVISLAEHAQLFNLQTAAKPTPLLHRSRR